MSSFFNFPKVNTNEVSICGRNERMSTLPVNLIGPRDVFHVYGTEYPAIDVRRDLFTQGHHDVSVLLPVHQSLLKHICSTYFEDGVEAALHEAGKAANDYPTLAKAAWGILGVLDLLRGVKNLFHTKQVETDHVFAQTRNWPRSPIRCIAWHPNCFKLAVAITDDTIKLYQRQVGVDTPVLKRKEQKGILCMAWRPWSPSELAVGTQRGLIIWNVDQYLSCVAMKSQSTVLPSPTPVTSVAWNPSGTLLASATIASSDILIWDVDHGTATPLKRVKPPGALVSWSPNGSTLCATTTGCVFRIWNTDRWTVDRWTIERGTVQSVTWTPCSLFMLFVTTEEPFLYCLGFAEDTLFVTPSAPPHQAIPIADLTKSQFGEIEVGGQAQCIVVNPRGTLLAISFKETSSIAIFSVSISKFVLNVTPFGLINGLGLEYPTIIAFENTKERDTLTICWSSGRVQFFPFVSQ